MYTRCPGCHAVHPVNAAILAAANGRYRCGKCGKVTNAMESLFDHSPQGSETPPGEGEVPELGVRIDLEKAARERHDPQDGSLSGEGSGELHRDQRHWWRLTWVLASISIFVIAAFWFADFYGKPLEDRPMVKDALVKVGLADAPRDRVFRDLDSIHLVSREMRSHPELKNRLLLNATIVNRAEKKQPYPTIEVILLNGAGQIVTRLRYAPRDYLASGSDVTAGMTPDAYLPLSVEVDDPGRRAVGFELNFH